MKLYNTATKKLETFKPISNEVVKIYTCGPTVYSSPHIGNFASYIYWDLLIRTLIANGYKVNRVMNMTDVGHLTSDGDDGEDKLEKGARKENKTVWEVADFYINEFMDSFHALNLLEPEKICRATDYVKEDMAAVDAMIKNGFTYETADGIYFDTAKFADYAKFANLDLENLKAGARVEFSNEKRNPSDFAVWKFIQPGEKHAMRWDYLGRPGYPGWHLECSTIINAELGEPIDIHTGGIDHIPVHHTNEIAQTYAISGKALANYWLHCNFINIDGQRIAKSTGNIYTLADLAERGFSPLDYKLWVLQGHFQGDRNFTFEGLDAAKNRRLNWKNRIAMELQHPQKTDGKISEKLLEALNNNLNSAEAFAIIDNTTEISLDDWRNIDSLFGLKLIEETPDISDEYKALIKDREAARAAKDWQKSDDIRHELELKGITIKDTPDGSIWQYLK
ncbi:MAG: cysteine--tRNA ligase [Candidatus Saccharibacteria bacterium]|nr:cysteine--tRNA ligase [Candidatus Saccharibacteria bacterium]